MAISLNVVNGPNFAWGDEVIVQYQGDLAVRAIFTGQVTVHGVPGSNKTSGEFNVSYSFDQPIGIDGYTFVVDPSDPTRWIGNLT